MTTDDTMKYINLDTTNPEKEKRDLYYIYKSNTQSIDLFNSNIGIVLFTMKSIGIFKRVKNKDDIEELKQEGYLGLWKAINEWDTSKGSLSNYAFIKIKGRLIRYEYKLHGIAYPERRSKEDPKFTPEFTIVSISRCNSRSPQLPLLEERLEDRDSAEPDVSIYDEIKPLLNETELSTVISKVFYGREEKEIVEEINRSRSGVCKAYASALTKLRAYFS